LVNQSRVGSCLAVASLQLPQLNLLQPQPAQDEQGKKKKERPRPRRRLHWAKDLKDVLDIAIKAALARGETLDHLLLYGPPGLGKTTMALILASEMGWA